MQLLTGASYHFFRYNTTTADWDSIKNSIDTSDVTFTRLAAANLYYGSFEKLVEGFSPLSISDIPENPVELMASPRHTSDRNRYKKDTFVVDKNNDGEAVDDGAVDDRAIDENNN